MARSLRIPGLVDLIRVDDPAEIRARQRSPPRPSIRARGPLGQPRFWSQRIRSVSAGRRHAAAVGRAARRSRSARAAQDALRAPSSIADGGKPLWDDRASRRSRARVCVPRRLEARSARASRRSVGRLFVPDYRGDQRELGGGQVLDDRAPHTRNPLRAICPGSSPAGCSARAGCWRARQGRLRRRPRHRRSPCTISCGASSACASCGAIRAGARCPADAVVEQCLCAPPSVLRQATVPGATTARRACGRARSSCCELDAARARAPGREIDLHDAGAGAAVPGRSLRAGPAARRLGTCRRRNGTAG